MAQQAADLGAKNILCAIDARMNEVYWAEYTVSDNQIKVLTDEKVSHPDNVILMNTAAESFVACGTGVDTYPELLANVTRCQIVAAAKFPTAESMLKLGQKGLGRRKIYCSR